MKQVKIIAIYGSPRRRGNTAALLKKAVEGARDSGADVEEIILRDLKISPCLEIYGCLLKSTLRKESSTKKNAEKIIFCGLKLARPPLTRPFVGAGKTGPPENSNKSRFFSRDT